MLSALTRSKALRATIAATGALGTSIFIMQVIWAATLAIHGLPDMLLFHTYMRALAQNLEAADRIRL